MPGPTFQDVIQTLNQVVPFDWRGLLEKRLSSLSPDAPLFGIEAAGWKLAYGPEPTAMQRAEDRRLCPAGTKKKQQKAEYR